MIAVAVTEDFYNKYKNELEVFVDAQENIIDYIENNHDATMETVATELDLDKQAVEEMFAQYDFNIEITEQDHKAFQNIADFMYETQMIEQEMDTETLFIQ